MKYIVSLSLFFHRIRYRNNLAIPHNIIIIIIDIINITITTSAAHP